MRSDNPDFLETMGVLFDVDAGDDADIEYTLSHDLDQFCLELPERELYRGASVDLALIALYGHLYEEFVVRSRCFLLHAGSAVRDGKAVAMPGGQESGKSTLTAVLAANEWAIVSDDVTAIDRDDLSVQPYPRRLLIRPETIVRNPIVLRGIKPLRTLDAYGELVYVARTLKPRPVSSVPLDHVVFPRWAHRTAVRPLSAGETAARLMDNSLNLRILGYEGVRLATRMARNIRAHALEVSDPSEAVRLIEAVCAS